MPLLGPDELEPIWARMQEAKCFSRLTGEQKQWLALVRAIGRRDPLAMAISSQQLLEAGIAANDSQRLSLAIRAGILGNIPDWPACAGEGLWVRYGSKYCRRMIRHWTFASCCPCAIRDAFSRWTSAAPLAQGPH